MLLLFYVPFFAIGIYFANRYAKAITIDRGSKIVPNWRFDLAWFLGAALSSGIALALGALAATAVDYEYAKAHCMAASVLVVPFVVGMLLNSVTLSPPTTDRYPLARALLNRAAVGAIETVWALPAFWLFIAIVIRPG